MRGLPPGTRYHGYLSTWCAGGEDVAQDDLRASQLPCPMHPMPACILPFLSRSDVCLLGGGILLP